MIRTPFLLFVLLCITGLHAQDSVCINKKYVHYNNISVEAGGTGLGYSVNYERVIFTKKYLYESARIGISYPAVGGIDKLFIPLDYNLHIGKGKMKVLLGAGIIGLIGTNPSPKGIKNQNDYMKLYNQNEYAAISKYGTDRFERAFDLAYTGKLGFTLVGKKVDFYAYLNCFYIRFSTRYYFQPVWPCAGISFKL